MTPQHEWYTRATTVCPCPVLRVSTPGHPHMCEYCYLIRYVLTKSPTNDCPTCASPYPDDGIPSTYASCIIFALIHQNTFAERWNDIQNSLTPTQQQQLHPSLNNPQPDLHAVPVSCGF